MQNVPKYGGVIVPILTPFTPDGHVDRAAIGRIVNYQIDSGVHALFLVGTMGEGLSMPAAERVAVVKATAEAMAEVKSTLPMYVSISANCLRDSLDMAARFMDAAAGRVTALVAHAPFYFPVTTRELDRYFQLLADAVPAPLMIYNIPVTTKISLPIETVVRLIGHPKVVGLKDSDREASRVNEMLAAVGKRDNFVVAIGNGLLATEGMKRGAVGVVVSGANIVPALWVKWWNAVVAALSGGGGSGGDWSRAEQLQAELDAVTLSYQQGRPLGTALASLKAMMAKQGLCDATVLPPLITERPG